MSNNWEPKELSIAQIDDSIKNGKYKIPRFQRGIVWTSEQRQDLIDTIKRGLPFGSILLYEDKEGTFLIIDGLQRSKALIEFRNNPTQFFNDDDIDPTVIRSIIPLLGVVGNELIIEDKLNSMIVEWLREDYKTIDDVEGIQFSDFGRKVSEEWPTCQGNEFKIGDLIKPMLNRFKTICRQVNSTKVPAIVLHGDSDQLSVLFERINSKGTQLSKYDIYAASWSGDKFSIDDTQLSKELVKYNKDRYDCYLEGTMQLDDYDPIDYINIRELNAFEIAFGFGKYLCDTWPHLFGKSKEEKDVESIGFTLLNVCLGKKNNASKDFNSSLKNAVNEVIPFLQCVLEAVRITDKAIGKYCKFKLNSREHSNQTPLHTEFQISSIIASVFLCKRATIKYDENENVIDIQFDLGGDARWNQGSRDKFKKNVGKIYISDIISGRWSGTGDKKLDDILRKPQFYMRDVSKEEFKSNLEAWFNTQNRERSEFKKVASVKPAEKVILSAIYMNELNAGQQVDHSNYDIEHLAPINLMKKHLDRFDGNLRLPISSIGNLCLLPEYANRSKRDKTLYQDTEYLKSVSYALEDIEETYSFTEHKDLEWIEDESLPENEFEKAYMEFIFKHFEKMKDKLLDNYSTI